MLAWQESIQVRARPYGIDEHRWRGGTGDSPGEGLLGGDEIAVPGERSVPGRVSNLRA
jgi:hypothetical protein